MITLDRDQPLHPRQQAFIPATIRDLSPDGSVGITLIDCDGEPLTLHVPRSSVWTEPYGGQHAVRETNPQPITPPLPNASEGAHPPKGPADAPR